MITKITSHRVLYLYDRLAVPIVYILIFNSILIKQYILLSLPISIITILNLITRPSKMITSTQIVSLILIVYCTQPYQPFLFH